MFAVTSQNVVERVVEMLHRQHPDIKIPSSIVRAASEKYRLLAIQVRVGTIQLQPSSQKDTAERRAAALLEYCTRQCHNNNEGDTNKPFQLSWKHLATAVQAKSPEPIQQLQHIMLNFLQPSSLFNRSTTNRQSTNTEVLPSLSEEQNQQIQSLVPYNNSGNNLVTTTIVKGRVSEKVSMKKNFVPRLLPELVIKLAGHLVDPHGALTLATQLLMNIYSYCRSESCSDAVEQRGQLYDLQRYGAAYEAAALYYVATSMYQNNREISSITVNKRNKRRKSNTGRKCKDEAINPEDVNIQSDEEEELMEENLNTKVTSHLRELHLDDIVAASTEYSYLEVKQVLPRVQELAKLLISRNTCPSKIPEKKRHNKTKVGTFMDESRFSADDQSRDTGAKMESSDRNSRNEFDALPIVTLSFGEWKSNILSVIKEQAKRDSCFLLSIENDNAAPCLTDNMVVKFCANTILGKYGLLNAQIPEQI